MPYLQIKRRDGCPIGRVEIDGDPLTIGRSSTNRLVLSNGIVSRRHCVIDSAEASPRVVDLGSKHGTRVNQKTVRESMLLNGDRIGVGPYELIYFQHAPQRHGAEAIRAECQAPPPRDRAAAHPGRDSASPPLFDRGRPNPALQQMPTESKQIAYGQQPILDMSAFDDDEAALMARIFSPRGRRVDDPRADRDLGAWLVAAVLLGVALGTAAVLIATPF